MSTKIDIFLEKMSQPAQKKASAHCTQEANICPPAAEKPPVQEEMDAQKGHGPEHGVQPKGGLEIQPQRRQGGPGHAAAGAGDAEGSQPEALKIQRHPKGDHSHIDRAKGKLIF